MKIKNKEINLSLDWDNNQATFNDVLEVELEDGYIAVFNLFLATEEKTTKSNDYDTPDDVEVKITDIEVSNIIVYDEDNDIVSLTKEQEGSLEQEVKDKICF